MSLRFSLLGPVRAWRDDDEIPLGPRQQRAVLAALLLNNGKRLSHGRLIGMVWEDPPASAVTAVRTYVYKLRKLFPELELTVRDGGYTIRAEIVDDGAGDPLEDLQGSYFDAQRVRLVQRRLKAEEDRLEREMDTLALQNHVAAHPLREHPRALLMHALFRDGRQAEALDQFHEARLLLSSELGIDPGPELREVHRAVLDGTAAHVGRPDGLPPELADFTGRASERRRIVDALPGTVGITGMRGSGKTALAVQVAHTVKGDYPDGRLFARGATAVDDLLGAIGVRDVPADRAAAVWREEARGKRYLVVVDDVESADQVRDLATPGSALILTSVRRIVELPAATWVKVAGLEPDEAHHLFRSLLGAPRVDAEPAAVAELLDRVSHLPEPIRVGAGRLAGRPQWTIDMLLRQMDQNGQAEAWPDISVRSACGALLTPLHRAGRQLAEHERRLLMLLADPAAEDITTAEAAALSGDALGPTEMTLESLADVHLIEPAGRGRYLLPRFVRSQFRASVTLMA
jgi:SARP family transcriptional regulator, regulator of embCAB operon